MQTDHKDSMNMTMNPSELHITSSITLERLENYKTHSSINVVRNVFFKSVLIIIYNYCNISIRSLILTSFICHLNHHLLPFLVLSTSSPC